MNFDEFRSNHQSKAPLICTYSHTSSFTYTEVLRQSWEFHIVSESRFSVSMFTFLLLFMYT